MTTPYRHTTSFQRRYDVAQHRTMSYPRWNDVVCLQDSFFLYILVEEKEGYLNKLDSDFSTIIGQILKFDELQVDILTQLDPQLWEKIDLVKAVIEVCSRTFIFSCSCLTLTW